MKKKILSVILTIAMIIGMLPGMALTAFATEGTDYTVLLDYGGNGYSANEGDKGYNDIDAAIAEMVANPTYTPEGSSSPYIAQLHILSGEHIINNPEVILNNMLLVKGGTLTISNGTYNDNVYVMPDEGNTAVLNITGGAFISEDCVLCAFSSGVLNISGGTIRTVSSDSASTVVVTGGSFIYENDALEYLPTGYGIVENTTTGYFDVFPEARWGTDVNNLTEEGAVADAFAAATTANSTIGYIKLECDITTDTTFEIESGTFTVDLNGRTVTSDESVFATQNSEVTFIDSVGSASICSNSSNAIDAYSSSYITIEGGCWSGDRYPVSLSGNSNFTVSGGCFHGGTALFHVLGTAVTLTITGNTAELETGALGDIVFEGTGKVDLSGYAKANNMVLDNLSGNTSLSDIILPSNSILIDKDRNTATEFATDTVYTVAGQASVNFDANGGSGEMASVAISSGNSYELPNCGFNSPTGKLFGGWLVNETSYKAGDTVTVDNDITVTAIWVDIVTVQFVANNGTDETMPSVAVGEGNEYTLPDCDFTAPEGKIFLYWTADDKNYTPSTIVTINANTTFTAVWASSCTVTFDANGGTGTMEEDKAQQYTTYTLPDCEFYPPAGMLFKAWLVTDGENEYEYRPGRIITVESDLTCTAIWTDAYTVSFDANEGNGNMDDTSVLANGNYVLPECTFTAPENMVFSGWAVGDTIYEAGDSIAISANTTIYAVWRADPSTCDLVLGGIGMADGQYLPSGSAFVTTTKPTEGGWAYYKDGTLTLHNYSYSGTGHTIEFYSTAFYASLYCTGDLDLVLEGENHLSSTSSAPNTVSMFTEGDLTVSGPGCINLSSSCGLYAYPISSTDSSSTANISISGGNIHYTGSVYMAVGISAYGNVTITGGNFDYSSSPSAMSAVGITATGDVLIPGGVLNLDLQTSTSYAIQATNVCIGTAPTLASDSFTHTGNPNITIASAGQGIDSDVLAIYDGILSIIAEGTAVTFTACVLGDNVTIQTPADGSIDEENGAIADAEGNPASVVFITESTCQPAQTYTYNTTHHWQPCLDPDCTLHSDPSKFQNYGAHDTNGTEGACSVCGYIADSDGEIYVGGFALDSGEYLSTDGRITTTAPASGGYAHYQDGVLTLNNYSFSGNGYCYSFYENEESGEITYYYSTVYSEDDLEIVLVGENALTQTWEYSDCITTGEGTVTMRGTGTLNLTGAYGIYTEGNFTLESGTLNITSYEDGLCIYGDVLIQDGSVSIDAADEGIYARNETILQGGTVNISAGYDGIYSDDVTITGGNVTIQASEYCCIEAYVDISIEGGTVVLSGYCGLYAADDVHISAGTLNIDSTYGVWADDDVIITGGTSTIYGSKNGIYSEYWLEIYGSDTIVDVTSDATGVALCAEEDIYLESPVTILTPKEGYVIYSEEDEVYYVVDSQGTPACKAYLSREKTPSDSIFVAGVELLSGDYLAVNKFVTTQTQPDGGYAYYKDGVLTLNNYSYTGMGYEASDDWFTLIYSANELAVELLGENTLTATEPWSSGISVEGPLLTLDGNGSITITAGFPIDAYGDMTFNGGTFNLNSFNLDETVRYVYGVYAVEDLTINGGTFNIEAFCDYVDENGDDDGFVAGMYVRDGDLIINDGTITIDVYGNRWGNGLYVDEGDLIINGGALTISSASNNLNIGIYVDDSNILINGGNIDVTADGSDNIKAYGIYCWLEDIIIEGGHITVNSQNGIWSDDHNVTIHGGVINVTAEEVGIYSTYLMTLFGNNIHLNVTTSAENCALYSVVGLDIGNTLTVLVPADGMSGAYSEGNTILDTDGNAACTVIISGPHSFGQEYAFNDTHHWLLCEDSDCSLPADGSIHQYYADAAYAEHTYGEATYEWHQDNGQWTCTATRKCICGTTLSDTAVVTSVVKTPAGCEAKGWTIYTATFTEAWAEVQTKDLEDIPAVGHSWQDTTYSFAEDGKTCMATRVCGNDAEHVETATAVVTSAVKTPAGCETKGWTIYTATFTETWAEVQTKDVEDIPATGHTYGELIKAQEEVHTQTELKAAVAAHYQCSVCQKYFTEGKVETTLEALTGTTPSHSYGGWVTDDDTNHWKECSCGLKAEDGAHVYDNDKNATCNTCGHYRTIHNCSATLVNGQAATCTVDGWKDYYKCSCGKVYEDINCVTEITDLDAWKIGSGKIAAGHTYSNPNFTWAENLSSAKATVYCECGDSKIADCDISFVIVDGVLTIKAQAVIDGQTVSDTQEITVNGNDQLILPEDFTCDDTIIMVAFYNDAGQMTDIQTYKTSDLITLSGIYKVFFLNADLAPIFPNLG